MRAPGRLLLAAALALAASAAAIPTSAVADAAPFDLAGPGLEVTVSRAGQTLPIARAPSLAAGDQLWIKADLPPGQSAHYLLIAAFLRGATNPPPKSWFSQSPTWGKKAGQGMTVTVPQGAQQVLLFLAPETGGDFPTLVNAVRSRPGAFVRASQDLHQATLDRSRLDAFTAAIRRINETEPSKLKAASPLLARSLSIKLDADCLQKTVELQAPCLVQGRDSLVLADGHATSMVQALTTGYSAELVQQLSYTPKAGGGYYSPYVSSVLDIAHIMDSVRTAHYQYIPTLATAQGDRLSLFLNAPPSFQDPKSVLVVALPQVSPPDPPPLHPVDERAYCAQQPNLLLPVEGAPLVFSTRYARDLALRVTGRDGQTLDLPVRPDPERGGLAVDASGLTAARFGPTVQAQLQGRWGFTSYKGPTFTLQVAQPQHWQPSREDQQALLAGGDAVVRLSGATAACVEGVEMQAGAQPAHPVSWSAPRPDEISLKAPLGKPRPRSLTVAVRQYGLLRPDEVKLLPVDLGARIDGLDVHAGETVATLRGSQLKAVTGVTLGGVRFTPAGLSSEGEGEAETLALSAATDARPPAAGEAEATVAFADGHTSRLDVTVGPPRPGVSLIAKSFQDAPNAGAARIALGDKDLAPFGARITFSLRASQPAGFRGDEKVEVAGPGDKVLATLTTASGLVLADSQVAIATLDTGKALNASTAGPLSFRVVRGGTASHWAPLATLVRLPKLESVSCPADAKKPCALKGSDLFLIDSLSNSAAFKTATQTPEGYTDSTLDAPRPAGGKLYLRLHDDPAVVNVVTFTPEHRTEKGAS